MGECGGANIADIRFLTARRYYRLARQLSRVSLSSAVDAFSRLGLQVSLAFYISRKKLLVVGESYEAIFLPSVYRCMKI